MTTNIQEIREEQNNKLKQDKNMSLEECRSRIHVMRLIGDFNFASNRRKWKLTEEEVARRELQILEAYKAINNGQWGECFSK